LFLNRIQKRGAVEVIDRLDIQALQVILGEYPYIAAAYLFGSCTSGKATPLSDVDIAILLNQDPPGGRNLLHEEDYLAYRIGKAIAAKEVDLVDLNNKGVIFQHNVLRTGRLIYDADPPFRIRLEKEVIIRFCDFEPTLRLIEKLQLKSRMERLSRP
jgi:predicted nucleotidyltransferase